MKTPKKKSDENIFLKQMLGANRRSYERGPLCIVYDNKGSEAGSPLRAHAFSDCERDGVMVTPFASLYISLNKRRIHKLGWAAIYRWGRYD